MTEDDDDDDFVKDQAAVPIFTSSSRTFVLWEQGVGKKFGPAGKIICCVGGVMLS
jgi:hypothetical protein